MGDKSEVLVRFFNALHAPFDEKLISFRVGPRNRDKTSGMPLAYIDARDVMERLDTVVGAENWTDQYHGAGSAIVCELRIRLPDGEWLMKSDAASAESGDGGGDGGGGIDAGKSAVSNAFKRAAVKFGVGRYLYYSPNQWYPLEGGYLSDSQLRKVRHDFGAWQRSWFGDDVGAAPLPPPTTRPVEEPRPTPMGFEAKPPAVHGLDTEMREFMATLSRANKQRAEDRMSPLKGDDILYELESMNFKTNGVAVTNWNDLKQFGRDAIVRITAEIDSRPCLIGKDIPF